MKQRWIMVIVGLVLTVAYGVAADTHLTASMLSPVAILPLYLFLATLLAIASYLCGQQRFPLN